MLLRERNPKVRDLLADALKAIGEQTTTKPQKQELYQKLMACLQELENTIPGGKDHPDYQKAESAIENYITQYSLMVVESQSAATSTTQTKPMSATNHSNEELEKFQKLVGTCYRQARVN